MSTDYATLGMALDGLRSAMTVSELHGGFCGVLCAGGAGAASSWLEDCLREADSSVEAVDQARNIFRLVELDTWRALASSDMEFSPLLPEDDLPLDARVSELAFWCHGFVSGLAVGGLTQFTGSSKLSSGAEAEQENPAEEIVRDFIAISRAGITEDELSDPDAADFDVAELIEYVRVSVQIMFEEFGDNLADGPGPAASLTEH